MSIDTRKHILLRMLLSLALIISCVSMIQTEIAKAACGWGIRADIDGGYAGCGQGESQDGAFKSELITDGDQGYFKITLNNYHGGSILYECYGTCGKSVEITKTVVELIGDNTISAPDGVGIRISSPIEFTGQGKLEITAMLPIGGGYLCYWFNPPAQTEQSTCSFDIVDDNVAKKIKDALGTQTVLITSGTVIRETETPSQSQTGQNGNDIPTENEEGESDSDEDEKRCPDPVPAEQIADNGWTVLDIAVAGYIDVSLVVFIVLTLQWFIKRKKVSVSKNTVSQDSENSADSQDNTQGML